jgi:thiamine biosynthesis lipoprotein
MRAASSNNRLKPMAAGARSEDVLSPHPESMVRAGEAAWLPDLGVRGVAGECSTWLLRDAAIMGTAIRVELLCHQRAAGEAAIDAVMDEMHRIDRAMSPYREDSELSRINREAALKPVPLSEEMFRLIARAKDFSRLSAGAFDITYAAVGRLYDYRRGMRPDAVTLAEAREAVGYQQLELDACNRSLWFARPGMCIDLGGFAKGHAVDNGAAILRAHGIRHAIVTAGGDSHILGDRCGLPWTMAIRDPRRPGEVVAVLPLQDVAVSTSGDYERYFEADGVRWHHLIDPATGLSPASIHSVTIIADDGLTSEGLSKSVFVLGLERGMRLVESMPGVDAVVIDAKGQLHYSSGLLDGSAGMPAPPSGASPIPATLQQAR